MLEHRICVLFHHIDGLQQHVVIDRGIKVYTTTKVYL